MQDYALVSPLIFHPVMSMSCPAHHYLSQFGTKKIDALSSVGTTMIMNLDTKDARYLTKDLQDLVSYKDLITLERGEAIARIGNEVIRLKTPGPLRVHEKDYREDILRYSKALLQDGERSPHHHP